MRYAIKSIENQAEWKPLFQCIHYFISALPYALKEKQRKRIYLTKMFNLLNENLAANQLSGQLLTFAQELKSREAEIQQAWDIGEQKIAAMSS